jgi:hypothetical protein
LDFFAVVGLKVRARRMFHWPATAHFALVRLRELFSQLGPHLGCIHTAEALVVASAVACTDADASLNCGARYCGLQSTRARSEGVIEDCFAIAISTATTGCV